MGVDPTLSRHEIGSVTQYHKGRAALRHYANLPNFTSTYRGVNAHLAECLNSVLNVKALVGAFNQERALVGAFSVIGSGTRPAQPPVTPLIISYTMFWMYGVGINIFN